VRSVEPRLTFPEYAAIRAVNWSTLKELARSPLHYSHRLFTPREDSDTLRLGRATHTAVFEPERFLAEYALWEGTARRGKAWEAFEAEHAERTILTAYQYQIACDIQRAVRAHPVAKAYLGHGHAECSITWTDERTGLECKGRLDWLTVDPGSGKVTAIVDLKTARAIDARSFARAVAVYMYHCQGAFYRRGWLASHGLDPETEIQFVNIAVESSPPHDVAVYRMSEDAIWHGGQRVDGLMDLLAECKRTGQYPGAYPEEVPLELPAWAIPEDGTDAALPDWLAGTGMEASE
jgi:hypothetical protein